MRLYLIRHGKTDAHLENKRQTPDSPLGELGRQQAKATAKKLKEVKAEVLISSNWPRAVQTAEIISREVELPITINPQFHEQDKAKSVEGVLDESEVNQRFLEERAKSADELNFDWKFEDEGESMNEMIFRATRVCAELIKNYPHKKVIVVTHGVFMAALIATMTLGAEAEKQKVVDFFRSFSHHNAGITVLDYDEEKREWSLVSLNDHSHLA